MKFKKPPSLSIRNWSEEDRPRERLLLHGRRSLTDAELLSIIIGSGTKTESAVGLSRRILSSVDNDLTVLSGLSVERLMRFKGIGEAKAVGIAAALELANRKSINKNSLPEKITSSEYVNKIMCPILSDLEHEEFWILYLNNGNRIIKKLLLSKGGITGTLVDIRLVLKRALELGATGLILVHNHPSGTLKPSEADKMLTDKIILAAATIDIKVLDHLIITKNSYYSFADAGLIN